MEPTELKQEPLEVILCFLLVAIAQESNNIQLSKLDLLDVVFN